MGVYPALLSRNGYQVISSVLRNKIYNFSTTTSRMCKTSEEGEVIVKSLEGGKGLLQLNRPKQLNTLNVNMVCKIREELLRWQDEKYLIYLRGTGEKAFCAGGDVVAVVKDKTGATGKKFFREEYKMDALISSFKLPFISLIDGIVMGGGVGISLFGKYRIATERSMFAMPETQIGFFPDVGVSYHLSRMQYSLGYFLALIGYRLKGYDLVHAGIATHYCLSSDIKNLENALLYDFQKSCSSTPEEILCEFQTKALQATKGTAPAFSLADNTQLIDSWFSSNCLDEAIDKIKCNKSPFATETLGNINKMSPLSLKVTYRQLREAGNSDVFECFNRDFRLALRMLTHGDFAEGVRALLIDKDKKPKWKHQDISKVGPREVDEFFCPLGEGEELNLPKSLCESCC